MSDLGTQIRTYVEEIGPLFDPETLMTKAEMTTEQPAGRGYWRLSAAVVFVSAFVLVLGVGAILVLLRGSEPASPVGPVTEATTQTSTPASEPRVATTIAATPTTEAASTSPQPSVELGPDALAAAERFYEYLNSGDVTSALTLTDGQGAFLERLPITVDGFHAQFDYECHLEFDVVECSASVTDDLYTPADLSLTTLVQFGYDGERLTVSYLDDTPQSLFCSYLADLRDWSAASRPGLEDSFHLETSDSSTVVPCDPYPFTSAAAPAIRNAVREFVLSTYRWHPTDPSIQPPEPGETEPDTLGLASGWEHTLKVSLPSWSFTAGHPDTGYLVRGLRRYWSDDGVTWEEAQASLWSHDFAANGIGFVGAPNAMPIKYVHFSSDGQGWTPVQVGVEEWAAFLRVKAGPEGFLLIGADQTCEPIIRFSADGQEWLPVEVPEGCRHYLATPTGNGWTAVTERNGQFLIFTSNDGITWNQTESTQPPPPIAANLDWWPGYQETAGQVALHSNGETLVLAGKGISGWWTSVNQGITWTKTNDYSGRIGMTVTNLGYIAVGDNRIWHSPDGITWTTQSIDARLHDIVASGDNLIAIAVDGIYTWTAP